MDIQLLIIDDHPAMIEGYKTILSYANHNFKFKTALNCEEALLRINENVDYDVIFLDISLPPFKSQNIHSGIEIASIIKKQRPNSKLVILTSHIESLTLYSIVKKINPNGLLVKSDFSAQELIEILDDILKGETIYTNTVRQSIKNINGSDFYLDAYNRQIIHFLNEGKKTKSLPTILNLSLSAIDKRKALIKDFLGISKGSDEDIIREARKRGLI